jgi:arsenite methyltransferase
MGRAARPTAPRCASLIVGHGPGIGITLAADAVQPSGHVTGVDPSATMREMAAARCTTAGRVLLRDGTAELLLRDGTAERTECAAGSMDAAISVNNVMLWERPAGFAELRRVLRPGGRLVITVHRHVLGVPSEQLEAEASAAGFTNLTLSLRERWLNSPAIELLAQRPQG